MKTQLTKLAFVLILFSFGCDRQLNTTTRKSSDKRFSPSSTTNTAVNSGSETHSLSTAIASARPPAKASTGDLISFKTKGNKLTPQMLAAIKSAKPGTKVYLEDIMAVGPDGRIRELSPICITLK